MFAHRGGSALAPENTIAAFDHGLALGADGLELDVHLSRDGVVVVHHDRDARPDDEPSRAESRDRTADELARADAGYRFRRRTPASRSAAGASACRRSTACSRATATCRVIVELKVNDAELARAAVDVVRRRATRSIASASARSAGACCAPRAPSEPAHRDERGARGSPLGALSIVVPLAGVAARLRRLSGAGVVGPHARVSPRFVDATRIAPGLGVQVWTVDDRSRRAPAARPGASTR